MILCENGHENEDGATYCKVCHVYIDSTVTPEPPAPAPPGITVSPERVALAPGGEATVTARISNVGAAPDDYVIEVVGTAGPWASVSPWTVALAPGAESDVSVTVKVPIDPAPPPGEATCSLRVRSEANPDIPVTRAVTIEVTAGAAAASATLDPVRAAGYGKTSHVVTVVNDGSTPFAAAVGASDPTGTLGLTVTPDRVEALPGGRATAGVVATHPTRHLWAKDDTAYGFEIVVAPEGAPPIALAGETVARPRFPRWLVAALIPLVVAAVALARPWEGGRAPLRIRPPLVQVGASYEEEVLQDGPVAYWRLNELGEAVDSSGSGLVGMYVGDPVPVQGPPLGAIDGAIALDSADYIDIPNSLTFTDFTLEAWVFLVGDISNADAIVGQAGPGQDVNFYDRRLRLFVGGPDQCELQFTGDPCWDVIIADTTVESDGWNHWVITREGENLRLFLNGVEDSTGGPWSGLFAPKAIGWGNAGTLVGAIDEVALYGHALSQDRVQAHFEAGVEERDS